MTAEEKKRRKEVILSLMTDPLYRPMRAREIAVFLDVPKERREDLQEVLDELAKEGRIRVSGRGKYMRPEKHRIAGVFHANAKGFGFVSIEGSEQDIFIPRESTHGAMDGDTVRISVEPGQQFRRAEGAVREVLKRANPTVVGYYRRVQNFGLVMPDNQRLYDDIYVAPGKAAGAVVVRITRFPRNQEEEPEGEVEEILGHVSEPGVDILSISRAFGLPDTFPQEAMQEAESLRNTDFSDLAGRRDYRDLPTVTIDGEDAKDFDDAVTLKELPDGGAELYVHIADVSWFVREGSALDKEAYRRGTSVYLAAPGAEQRPVLPEAGGGPVYADLPHDPGQGWPGHGPRAGALRDPLGPETDLHGSEPAADGSRRRQRHRGSFPDRRRGRDRDSRGYCGNALRYGPLRQKAPGAPGGEGSTGL